MSLPPAHRPSGHHDCNDEGGRGERWQERREERRQRRVLHSTAKWHSGREIKPELLDPNQHVAQAANIKQVFHPVDPVETGQHLDERDNDLDLGDDRPPQLKLEVVPHAGAHALRRAPMLVVDGTASEKEKCEHDACLDHGSLRVVARQALARRLDPKVAFATHGAQGPLIALGARPLPR